MPQDLNHPKQSSFRIKEKAFLITSGRSEADLTFIFLKIDLIFEHIFSIGLKSGLYGGKCKKSMFAFRSTSATFLHDENAYYPSLQCHLHVMWVSILFQDNRQNDLR